MKILVIGDAMLDRYWEGRVDRISPEAPVPILQVTREFCRAGGAANVALNLIALGSPVALVTLLGEDEAGRELSRLMREHAVELHALGGARHKTAQQIRCVAQCHQLLRADFEEPASDHCVMLLMAACRQLLPYAGVVVLSDYGKGSLHYCAELVEMAADRGCTVLVDPKGHDFARYRGAWLLKPNADEVAAVVGEWADESDFRVRCEVLRESLAITHLLVTRGDQGMTLFSADGSATHVPAQLREVYDLSGAGDAVLASMAHFVARGVSAREAMHWANKAAGVVVGKFGTASASPQELGLEDGGREVRLHDGMARAPGCFRHA